MSSNNLIQQIRSKQLILKQTARELKKHFVGLDDIIDKIIKDIETWYIMPELLTRPVIICLWGPTGVGKTDLVRRLVKLLHFSNRYCEIELTNKGSSRHEYHSSVSSILSTNPNVRSGEPSVILLDEIQNFRTKDENNHEIHDYKFRDVWTLLSDGKLPFEADINYIMQLLWQYNKKSEKEKALKTVNLKTVTSNNDKPTEVRSAKPTPADPEDLLDVSFEDEDEREWSFYTLNHFKKVLRLDIPIEEIATWTDDQKKSILTTRLNDPRLLYEEEDYSKSLIFISGNLDEAYRFAEETDEADVNADIFHELSQKITIIDIKRALTSRFKPEQIARFGNNHILYPSLSRSFFEIIIERRVEAITKRIREKHQIDVQVDKTILDLIYDNGVFPTQGVRPVFSTISEILECLLPKFLLMALVQKTKSIFLYYDTNAICVKIKDKVIRYPYKGTLDVLKAQRNKNIDRKVLTSVHEAGHSIAYALLFKHVPPQIVSTTTSPKSEGFICMHAICGAKEQINKKISVLLAGIEAEKLIFGEDSATSGGSWDLREATESAARMVRSYGMDQFKSWLNLDEPERANTDIDSTNPVVEEIIRKRMQETKDLLKANRSLLLDVAEELVSKSKLIPKEFQAICKKHGVNASIMEHKSDIYLDYESKLKKFKKSLASKAKKCNNTR